MQTPGCVCCRHIRTHCRLHCVLPRLYAMRVLQPMRTGLHLTRHGFDPMACRARPPVQPAMATNQSSATQQWLDLVPKTMMQQCASRSPPPRGRDSGRYPAICRALAKDIFPYVALTSSRKLRFDEMHRRDAPHDRETLAKTVLCECHEHKIATKLSGETPLTEIYCYMRQSPNSI